MGNNVATTLPLEVLEVCR